MTADRRHTFTFRDLSDSSMVRVNGADREDFLSRMLSQEIRNMADGERRESAFLTANGRVRAYFSLWKYAEEMILITEPGFEDTVIAMLDAFIITDDVKLENAAGSLALFEAAGKGAEDKLNQSSPAFQKFEYCGKFFFQCLVSSEKKAETEAFLKQAGAQGLDAAAYEVMRIEDGRPVFGKDITEEVLLPETTLEKISASETKGCYPGQEVVAKIETYGRLNRKLTGFIASGDLPPAGSKIFDGDKEVGWITSGIRSGKLDKNICLGYIAKGYFDAGIELTAVSGQKKTGITTSALPFI